MQTSPDARAYCACSFPEDAARLRECGSPEYAPWPPSVRPTGLWARRRSPARTTQAGALDDAVATTFYFIDVHTELARTTSSSERGRGATLPPRRACAPRGASDSWWRAHGLQRPAGQLSVACGASCVMAMGQAAGAAAALGVRQGVPSRDVPLDLLRDTLRAHGALVP